MCILRYVSANSDDTHEETERFFYNATSKSLPFSFRVEDERELSKQQARQEVLLAERDGELKHGGHTLVLHHTGEG